MLCVDGFTEVFPHFRQKGKLIISDKRQKKKGERLINIYFDGYIYQANGVHVIARTAIYMLRHFIPNYERGMAVKKDFWMRYVEKE